MTRPARKPPVVPTKAKTKAALESDLKRSVKSLLDALRVPYYENVQGPIWGIVRGRPDLEVIYKGVTYYLELKRYGEGKMSAYQDWERARIEAAGAPYIRVERLEDVIEAMDLPVLVR